MAIPGVQPQPSVTLRICVLGSPRYARRGAGSQARHRLLPGTTLSSSWRLPLARVELPAPARIGSPGRPPAIAPLLSVGERLIVQLWSHPVLSTW